MSEVFDEYGEQRETVAPENIGQEIEQMALLLRDRKDAVEACEAELTRAKGAYNEIRFRQFPELMKRAGNLVEWDLQLANGKRMHLDRSKDVSAAVSKGNRQFIFQRLVDLGYQNLLSSDLKLSYQKGQEAEVEEAKKKLTEAGLPFVSEEGIHSSRYTSWCDRMVEAGRILEEDFPKFGIHVVEQVTFQIKEPKKKRRSTAE